MFCGKCGSKAVEGDLFCVTCGQAQRPASASESIVGAVLEEPKTPAEDSNLAEAVQSAAPVDRTVQAVKSGGKPLYCRHSVSERTMLGVDTDDGSETCRGCKLLYAPGSPNSHLHSPTGRTGALPAKTGQAPKRDGDMSSQAGWYAQPEGEKSVFWSPKVLGLIAALALALIVVIALAFGGSQGNSGDARAAACARVATITTQLADMQEQMRLDSIQEGAGSAAYLSIRQSLERQMEPLRVELVVQKKVCKG